MQETQGAATPEEVAFALEQQLLDNKFVLPCTCVLLIGCVYPGPDWIRTDLAVHACSEHPCLCFGDPLRAPLGATEKKWFKRNGERVTIHELEAAMEEHLWANRDRAAEKDAETGKMTYVSTTDPFVIAATPGQAVGRHGTIISIPRRRWALEPGDMVPNAFLRSVRRTTGRTIWDRVYNIDPKFFSMTETIRQLGKPISFTDYKPYCDLPRSIDRGKTMMQFAMENFSSITTKRQDAAALSRIQDYAKMDAELTLRIHKNRQVPEGWELEVPVSLKPMKGAVADVEEATRVVMGIDIGKADE